MKHASSISSKDDKIINFVAFVICTLVFVLVAYPLIYTISASFSDPLEISKGKLYLLPKGFTIKGYMTILEYKPIWIGYRNTIFYTAVGTLINLILTLTTAYALSRKDFVGRNFFTVVFSITMFFSGGLIPTFMVMKSLNLTNTPWIMLLIGAVNTWNVIIARTYFQSSIPMEMQEAAMIDGCSNTKLFFRIVLPLAKPIVAVLGLFYAVSHWNSYFNALIYLTDRNIFPLQLFLRNILIMDQMADMVGLSADAMEEISQMIMLKETMKFGIIVVSSLPIIVAYPFLQKFFAKGIMTGSIKG